MNRFFNVVWLIVFSMTLVLSIQKGSAVWIVIDSLIILLNSVALLGTSKVTANIKVTKD
ncbi:hypothetical protein ACQKOK_28145 [Bacillus cereus]|uniref:hypothetical protein n=1 Tax=Bacillus cereus TaxID=1396 RepID=UPI003D05C44B